MADPSRRLSEADAAFFMVDTATGQPSAAVGISIFEGPLDPDLAAHHRELQSRAVPATRRRIARDRWSPALPRWVDCPDFRLEDHHQVLPPPGDGTLDAVIEWAQTWCLQPFDLARPLWRSVRFDGVLVDGVPRTVSVGQSHHSIIDGEGGKRLGLRMVQSSADEPLPELPEPTPPEHITAWERWKEGWAVEAGKVVDLARAGRERAAWAARHPRPAAARVAELGRTVRRFQADLGTTPRSPLLARRSGRVQFDRVGVDVPALKAGARAAGGSVNDGLLAAIGTGLRRWHADHGVELDSLRTTIVVNLRGEGGSDLGNQVVGVVATIPTVAEDLPALVRACGAVSRRRRTKDDVRLVNAGRALSNRIPQRLMVPMARRNLAGIDVQLSNLIGLPHPYWVAGQQVLGSLSFPLGSMSGLNLLMISKGATADLGITTDPEVVTDRAGLVARLSEAIAEVSALAPAPAAAGGPT